MPLRMYLLEMKNASNVIKLINLLVPSESNTFGILKKGLVEGAKAVTALSGRANNIICSYYNESIKMLNTDMPQRDKNSPTPEDLKKVESYLRKIHTNFSSMNYNSSIDTAYEMLTAINEFTGYGHPEIFIDDSEVGGCELDKNKKTVKTLLIDLKWVPRISLILQDIGNNYYKTEVLLEKGAFSKFLNPSSDAGNNIRESLGGMVKRLINSANDIPVEAITIGILVHKNGSNYDMFFERNGCQDTQIKIGSTDAYNTTLDESVEALDDSVEALDESVEALDDSVEALDESFEAQGGSMGVLHRSMHEWGGGVSMNRKGKKTKGKKVKDKKTKRKKVKDKKTKGKKRRTKKRRYTKRR